MYNQCTVTNTLNVAILCKSFKTRVLLFWRVICAKTAEAPCEDPHRNYSLVPIARHLLATCPGARDLASSTLAPATPLQNSGVDTHVVFQTYQHGAVSSVQNFEITVEKKVAEKLFI